MYNDGSDGDAFLRCLLADGSTDGRRNPRFYFIVHLARQHKQQQRLLYDRRTSSISYLAVPPPAIASADA